MSDEQHNASRRGWYFDKVESSGDIDMKSWFRLY